MNGIHLANVVRSSELVPIASFEFFECLRMEGREETIFEARNPPITADRQTPSLRPSSLSFGDEVKRCTFVHKHRRFWNLAFATRKDYALSAVPVPASSP